MIIKESEKDVQNFIMDYLTRKRIFHWKQHNVGIKKEDGGYIPAGKKGVSDILGILPDGRFLAIEVKGTGGKLSEYQEEFLAEINNNKGVAFMVDGVDSFLKKINDII